MMKPFLLGDKPPMVGTHKAEPTSQEMKRKMAEQMGQPAGTATAAA